MTWTRLLDSDNPANRNAGNGGDLARHSVYAGTLQYLLAHDPWLTEIRVRECHAGRGMSAIPHDDVRRPLLKRLFSPVGSSAGVALHDLQRASQAALGVWPAKATDLNWYSGSAVLNTYCLAATAAGVRQLELYEMSPETKGVLRAVFDTPAMQVPGVSVRILPEREDGSDFDGERHIETSLASWDSQDLIILDPFAMWRQTRDRVRRARYRRIVDAVTAKGQDAPLLMLFWTWGRAFPIAEGDLNGTNSPVENGYQEPSQHAASRGPALHSDRVALGSAVRDVGRGSRGAPGRAPPSARAGVQCHAGSPCPLEKGCGGRLGNPEIHVAID